MYDKQWQTYKQSVCGEDDEYFKWWKQVNKLPDSIPFNTMGNLVIDFSQSISLQVSDGSNKDEAYSLRPDCFCAWFIPEPVKSNFSKLAILEEDWKPSLISSHNLYQERKPIYLYITSLFLKPRHVLIEVAWR